MFFSLTQIIPLLIAYKYFLLFPIAVVEGPIITVIAGFLSSTGYFNVFIAYGVVIAADVTGDSIYYALGRWGMQYVNRWGRSIGLTVERIQKIERHYADHAGKTIMLGKLAYSIETPFLIAAGFAKVAYRKFIWYVFLPSIPKSLLFILIGYYFGRAYGEMSTYLSHTAFLMVAAAILLTGMYFIIGKMSKNTLRRSHLT